MTVEELHAALTDVQLKQADNQLSYAEMTRYLGHLQGFARAARLHSNEPLAQAFEQARRRLLNTVVRHDLQQHRSRTTRNDNNQRAPH